MRLILRRIFEWQRADSTVFFGMVTEAEILNDVLAPDEGDLGDEAARAILNFGFSEKAKDQIRALLDIQNRGEISDEQAASLKNYLQVGQLMDLLQAKARLSLSN